MPFSSEAQRRFLFARHPEVAERWEAHTPKGTKLPERAPKRAVERASRAALQLDQPRTHEHRRKHIRQGSGDFLGFGDLGKAGADIVTSLRPPSEDSEPLQQILDILRPDLGLPDPPTPARRSMLANIERPVHFGTPSSPDYGTRFEAPGRSIRTAAEHA